MNDLVSVIITTFNRPKGLKLALNSVLKQTYSPIEVIIVDDAGKPPVTATNDSRVKIISHKSNKGLAAARNTGWKNARGRYVAFLDDDDEFTPDKIEKQMILLKKKSEKYALVYCGQKVYRPNGSFFINRPKLRRNIKESIIKNDISSISSTYLFRKKVLEDIGGFDEDLKNSVDHDLWMTLAVRGYFCDFVGEPLAVNQRKTDSKRLTTDIQKRLNEVEKYITKWTPTYGAWYGEGADNYVEKYRYRVYSMLANDMLMKSEFKEAVGVYMYLFRNNPKKALIMLTSFWSRGLILFILSILFRFVSPQSKIRYY